MSVVTSRGQPCELVSYNYSTHKYEVWTKEETGETRVVEQKLNTFKKPQKPLPTISG